MNIGVESSIEYRRNGLIDASVFSSKQPGLNSTGSTVIDRIGGFSGPSCRDMIKRIIKEDPEFHKRLH